ncbi:MAG: hypothetical protein QM775_21910 [Pirellulales bacterium]
MIRRLLIALIACLCVSQAFAQSRFGGGGGMPMGGGGGRPSVGGGGYSPRPATPNPYGGGYNPGVPQPGGNRSGGYGGPSIPGSPQAPSPRGYTPYGNNGRPTHGIHGYDPARPNVPTPGRPYVPDVPTSSWQMHNPWSGNSRILPSTGHVDFSHTVAPLPTGAMSPALQQMRDQARVGNMVDVERQITQQMSASGPQNLNNMFATVNALHGVRNPKYQELRTSTLNLCAPK